MGGVSMEWKEVRLGDYIKTNETQYSIKENWENFVYLDTGSIIEGRIDTLLYFTKEDKLPSRARRKVQHGDIIYSCVRPNQRHYGYINNPVENLLVSTGFVVVSCKDIDSKYLYYYLTQDTIINYLQNIGEQSVSTYPTIKPHDIEDIFIRIPSDIEDQRRIASILSSLDRKIELNNKINADLEEMAQAIFKNWFVDFEPFKNGKFVDSELGMIPEGWKVGRLTDVIKLMPGGTPKTSEPLYWDNGTIPFFSPKDVNGVYCFATEKHITEAGLNKCSSNLYPKDTIFITCRGTVGKVCLAACDMAMNQSNYAIKAIDGYSQYYVFFLVKSVVERLIKKSNGAVFSAITSKDFDEEILIPSQKAVEDFANVIDGFFRRIFTIGTESSRLSLLRDTLLPRLMSGELEVPE